jgi:hypothetical protein
VLPGAPTWICRISARREKRSTEELLALYTLEGFLDRLATSTRTADLVLKGGALLCGRFRDWSTPAPARWRDHSDRVPAVVDAVVRFSEPALSAETLGQRWYPSDRAWSSR